MDKNCYLMQGGGGGGSTNACVFIACLYMIKLYIQGNAPFFPICLGVKMLPLEAEANCLRGQYLSFRAGFIPSFVNSESTALPIKTSLKLSI